MIWWVGNINLVLIIKTDHKTFPVYFKLGMVMSPLLWSQVFRPAQCPQCPVACGMWSVSCFYPRWQPHLHFNFRRHHKAVMRSAQVLCSNQQFTLSSIWHQRESFNLISPELWGVTSPQGDQIILVTHPSSRPDTLVSPSGALLQLSRGRDNGMASHSTQLLPGGSEQLLSGA